MILLAQLRDWEDFRKFQKRVRHYYRKPERHFNEFVDQVRGRRRRHGLGEDVRLGFSLEEKDRELENWIEFQAFHIQFHIERLESKLDDLRTKFDDARKEADNADAAVSKRASEFIENYQSRIEYPEQKLERERYFLQWTEQQRMAMDTRYPTPVEEDRVTLSRAVRRTSVSDCGKRQQKARSVLGKPGISKRQTRK